MTLNPHMKEFVDAYMNVLWESAEGKSRQLREEVENFEKKMLAAAEASGDPAAFAGSFMGSDLNTEYNSLIMKLATAAPAGQEGDAANQSGSIGAEETGSAPSSGPAKTSVRDFVDQYRPQYEEIARPGFRKKTESLYEEIFKLAEITDDLLEAQLILEEEGWQRDIFLTSQRELLAAIMEAMDLADPTISARVIGDFKAICQASGPEEYIYYSALNSIEADRKRQEALFTFECLLNLSLAITVYVQAKARIWDRPSDKGLVSKAVTEMNFNRKKAVRAYDQLLKLGIDDEKIRNSSLLSGYLMCATPIAGSLGKYKGTLFPPSAVDSYLSLYHEEIGSEKSLFECIKHKHRLFYMAHPSRSFKDEEKEACDSKISDKVSKFDYYKLNEGERIGLPEDLPTVKLD